MFKKIFSILVAVIILITCFSGCKKDDTANKAFYCAVSELPAHFDPQIANTTAERMVALNIFDGLFKLDENNVPQKCAVTDYSVSEDGLVYTFKLRTDSEFFISEDAKDLIEEKGGAIDQKITAEDFAFGISRAVLPETDSPDFKLLSTIKNATAIHNGTMSAQNLGVRVVDEYTLEITLEKATPDFLYALSQPVSYPCDKAFFELTAGRYGLAEEYIISNGAFYLSTITAEKNVRIRKNEEYKGDFSAIPASVGFYLNKNEVDIAKKVDDKTYDFGFFVSESAIDELGRSVVKTELQNINCALVFNMKKDAIKNSALRTGLITCIDMSAVTENPLKSILPKYYKVNGTAVDSTAVEGLSYNIDSARDNMVKAFKELEIETLTVELLCTPQNEKIAKSIISHWQKNIGVELNGTLVVAEGDEFTKKFNAGEYDAVICSLSVDTMNAYEYLSIFTSENNSNLWGYASEEYDRIITDFKNAPTTEKAVYAQSYLLKNAVLLPLYDENTVFALGKNVSGIYFAGDRSNVYFYKGQK